MDKQQGREVGRGKVCIIAVGSYKLMLPCSVGGDTFAALGDAQQVDYDYQSKSYLIKKDTEHSKITLEYVEEEKIIYPDTPEEESTYKLKFEKEAKEKQEASSKRWALEDELKKAKLEIETLKGLSSCKFKSEDKE